MLKDYKYRYTTFILFTILKVEEKNHIKKKQKKIPYKSLGIGTFIYYLLFIIILVFLLVGLGNNDTRFTILLISFTAFYFLIIITAIFVMKKKKKAVHLMFILLLFDISARAIAIFLIGSSAAQILLPVFFLGGCITIFRREKKNEGDTIPT